MGLIPIFFVCLRVCVRARVMVGLKSEPKKREIVRYVVSIKDGSKEKVRRLVMSLLCRPTY